MVTRPQQSRLTTSTTSTACSGRAVHHDSAEVRCVTSRLRRCPDRSTQDWRRRTTMANQSSPQPAESQQVCGRGPPTAPRVPAPLGWQRPGEDVTATTGPHAPVRALSTDDRGRACRGANNFAVALTAAESSRGTYVASLYATHLLSLASALEIEGRGHAGGCSGSQPAPPRTAVVASQWLRHDVGADDPCATGARDGRPSGSGGCCSKIPTWHTTTPYHGAR